MISRRVVFGLAATAALVVAAGGAQLIGGGGSSPIVTAAVASEKMYFSHAAFTAAQAAGKPILVDISASWCSTCARQEAILGPLTAKPKYSGLVVFEVNYDTQKSVVRELGAQHQSTLIAFRGNQEVGRSVADTNPSSIEAMLDRTI
ncbi:MAG: thioredoxin family protein [Alphaproteobacteria bacterium]